MQQSMPNPPKAMCLHHDAIVSDSGDMPYPAKTDHLLSTNKMFCSFCAQHLRISNDLEGGASAQTRLQDMPVLSGIFADIFMYCLDWQR